MIKIKMKFILLGAIGLFAISCDESKNTEQKNQGVTNQLVITSTGDTLETGIWKYDSDNTGISKSGNYSEGYKVDRWTYKNKSDSVSIIWNIVDANGVKLNIPNYFQPIDTLEPPTVLQADIEDGDKNTYLVLLKYNLKDLKLSIQDYLLQYNELQSDSEKIVNAKEFRKFTFEEIEVFRAKVETTRKIKYSAFSYIFVIDDFLYDLTYKNATAKISAIDLSVFNDILYSMRCGEADVFNYNNRQYVKEENVVFK